MSKEIGEQINKLRYSVTKFWKYSAGRPDVGDYKWMIRDNASGLVVSECRTRQSAVNRAALLNKRNGGPGYTKLF